MRQLLDILAARLGYVRGRSFLIEPAVYTSTSTTPVKAVVTFVAVGGSDDSARGGQGRRRYSQSHSARRPHGA